MRNWIIIAAGVVALLLPQAAAAAQGPAVPASRIRADCTRRAVIAFQVRAAAVNVMGVTQDLDNTWIAVGIPEAGQIGEKDFMCVYDTGRHFTDFKRLD